LFAVTDRKTVTPISIPAGQPGPPITVGHIPTALAVTRDGRTLYVADNNDQNVLPVDIATRVTGRRSVPFRATPRRDPGGRPRYQARPASRPAEP